MTATVIQEKQPDSNISLTISSLLREQYFGAGEGKKICQKERNLTLSHHYAKGKFPAIYTRTEKFPGGESLDDMTKRVDCTIDDILLPYVRQEAEGSTPMTVAIVSHGIFIAELISRLVKRDGAYQDATLNARSLRGLKNTAWTKVQVTFKVCCHLLCSLTMVDQLIRQKADSLTHQDNIQSPSLVVKVMAVNQCSHLANLVSLVFLRFFSRTT